MNFEIRLVKPKDLIPMSEWWRLHKLQPAQVEDFPNDSSFIICSDGIPMASIVAYLTNGEFVFLEGLIVDPRLDKRMRKRVVEELVFYCYGFAKNRGYKRVLCMTSNEKLAKRYTELGGKVKMEGNFLLEKIL